MTVNCACDDTTGYRTLSALRTDLYTRLGFVDPMANIATRTLALLRADLARRMGYAAQVAAGSYPPGISDLIDGFVNEAQQILFRRMELDKGAATLPTRMSADGDVTTLDYVPVQNLAVALMKSHRGDGDAKIYFEITERYLSDTANRFPPNAQALCTQFLQDAQRQLLRRYPALRMDRWFSWDLTAGERFYDLDDNAEQSDDDPCEKLLDTLAIKWVGYAMAEGQPWVPIRRGIPNTLPGSSITGWPQAWDIRQCLEIWPAPAATEGTLQIRAGFRLEAFDGDDDLPTLDDELVFLYALAAAKAHWKQADAQKVLQDAEIYLHGVVAGSHGQVQYVPRAQRGAQCVYVEPRTTEAFPT